MLASFVFCWTETWFLDFRVLPKERAARQRKNAFEIQLKMKQNVATTSLDSMVMSNIIIFSYLF